MPLKKHDRQYDLIVFGATGYTGKYTTQCIVRDLPTDLRWAIAGRSRGKLERLSEELKSLNPDRRQPEIVICQLNDEDLASLAKKTFVLITTVGPYGQYGEHAFKACAENGTHYLDVTGEVPFVAKMIKKYEDVAKRTGSMLFPETGVESAPADLLTWSVAKYSREHFGGAKLGEAVVSVHKLNSSPSGGTLATLISFFDMFSLKEIGAALSPYALSPVPNPQAKHQKESLWSMITGLRTVPELGLQTSFMGATTDRAIVHRTWGLFQQVPSRKDEFYGPQFRYSQHMKTRNWLTGIAMHWGVIVAATLLTALPPLRKLLKRFVYEPGQGPDVEEAKKEEMVYRAIGVPDGVDGKLAYCQASFRGSMYDSTGVILANAALTILEDELELGGGIFTPACLGQGVVDRLNASGFRFETETRA